MEQINKEMQMFAVEKVLEEMQKAEEYVKSWNASWYEQLLDDAIVVVMKLKEETK